MSEALRAADKNTTKDVARARLYVHIRSWFLILYADDRDNKRIE
jgi:hypothetical protein